MVIEAQTKRKGGNNPDEDEQMPMVTRFNVEMHTRSGKAIYLCQFGDGMEWTSNGDDFQTWILTEAGEQHQAELEDHADQRREMMREERL